MRTQQFLGAPQIGIDVRRGGEHNRAEPAWHVACKVIVDGGRTEEYQLWQLEPGFRLSFDLLERFYHGGGAVLAKVTTGNIVIGCHDEENGVGATHTRGDQLHVSDAALEDLDLLVLDHLGQQAMQLGFVAAVGMDLVLRCGEEILYESRATVAGAAKDGVSRHDFSDRTLLDAAILGGCFLNTKVSRERLTTHVICGHDVTPPTS